MSWKSIVSAYVLAIAIATSCQSTNSEPQPVPFPRAETWQGIMEHVFEPQYYDVLAEQSEKSDDAIDFDSVETAALDMARHMGLGHTRFARPGAPEFARFASEAEQWLREVAERAAAHDAAGLRTLLEAGEQQHCDRCHSTFS